MTQKKDKVTVALPDGRKFEVSVKDVDNYDAKKIMRSANKYYKRTANSYQQQQFGRQSAGMRKTSSEDPALDTLGKQAGDFFYQVGKGGQEYLKGGEQIGREMFGDDEGSQQIAQQYAEDQANLSGKQKFARTIGKTGAQMMAASPFSKSIQGLNLLGRLSLGAVSGGVDSALTPSQTDEGFAQQKTRDVAKGAGLGLGVGVAVETAKPIINIAKNIFSKPDPDELIGLRIPSNERREALQRLESADKDSPLALVDVANDEIKGLARSAAKVPVAQSTIAEALGRKGNRVSGESSRVTKQIDKISTKKDINEYIEEIKKESDEVATPLYKQMKDEGLFLPKKGNKELFEKIKPDIKSAKIKYRDKELNKYLKTDDDLMKDAMKKLGITNIEDFKSIYKYRKSLKDPKDKEILATFDKNKKELAKGMPMYLVDKAKKRLDFEINQAIKIKDGTTATELQKIKDNLTQKADEISPIYKKARKTAEGYFRLEDAAKEGKKFMDASVSVGSIKKLVSGFNKREKDSYKIGVAQKLQEMADSVPEGGSSARRIFDNDRKKDKIKAVFGNEKEYNKFATKMDDELDIKETQTRVRGGSGTDINRASDEQVLEGMGKGASFLATATRSKPELINRAIRLFTKKSAFLTPKNANEIAKALVYRENSIPMLKKLIAKEKDDAQKEAIKKAIKLVKPEVFATISINQNN